MLEGFGLCYPAMVTPLREDGSLDELSLLKLLALFEAAGCAGVVIGGTNGEGGLLSAVMKRDALKIASKGRGKLELIFAITSTAIDEAIWSARQAEKFGAAAVMVSPPRIAGLSDDDGLRWYSKLVEATELGVIAYNFPRQTGFEFSAELLARMQGIGLKGVKDSSKKEENLAEFPALDWRFVGDESLLPQATANGWNGAISGAANVIPHFMSRWANEPQTLSPFLDALRRLKSMRQPATYKGVLNKFGFIESSTMACPGIPASEQEISDALELLEDSFGMQPGTPFLPL